MTTLTSGGRRVSLQTIERAHQIADALDGETGVMAGRLDPRVSQQDLDVADVHPSLQQVRREGMTQGMRRDVLGDAGVLGRLLHRPAHDIDRQGLIIDRRAGEQPDFWLPGLPIPLAQHGQDLRGQDGVAVLPAFALLNTDDHPCTVDIRDLERHQLGDAQSGGIAQGEHDLVFEVRRVIEQPGDLVGGQHDRQLVGLTDVFGDGEHGLARQRDGVEEAESRDALIDGGDRQAASGQIEPEEAKIIGGRLVGRAVDKFGEAFDAVDVGDLGLGCQAADRHVVNQALTKRGNGRGCHGKLLSWLKYGASFSRQVGREFYNPAAGLIWSINSQRPLVLRATGQSMPKRLLLVCLVFALIAGLQGCSAIVGEALHGDTKPVMVEKRGDNILLHVSGDDGKAIITSGISVYSMRDNHSGDVCYWMIDVDPSVPAESRDPVLMPILYGQSFPGMVTKVVAMTLNPGRYLVSGDLVRVGQGKNYSARYYGEFVVNSDGSIESVTKE